MSKHTERFENVNVEWDKTTDYLYIDDAETGEQLAIFIVREED